MSFIPALEIGVWNVWIFMVAWVVFHIMPLNWPFLRHKMKALIKKGTASPVYSKNEKIFSNLGTIVWIVLLVYSIFLPLPLGTPLLYSGIALFVAGFVITEIATIPWVQTDFERPVTTGIYRFSRHPIYIGVFIQYIGIGIASASGLFLLLGIISIILSILVMPAEERFCLEKYGEEYRDYMNRTPRWLDLLKV